MDTVGWPSQDIQATTEYAKKKKAAGGCRRLQEAVKAEA